MSVTGFINILFKIWNLKSNKFTRASLNRLVFRFTGYMPKNISGYPSNYPGLVRASEMLFDKKISGQMRLIFFINRVRDSSTLLFSVVNFLMLQLYASIWSQSLPH